MAATEDAVVRRLQKSGRKRMTGLHGFKIWVDLMGLGKGWSGVTHHKGDEYPQVFKLQKNDSNFSLVESYLGI